MRFRRLTLRVTGAAVFGLLLVGTTTVGAQARPAPPGPGNSAAAKACQKGGWQNLVTSEGLAFASQDDCVAYAAHGGVLSLKPVARGTLTATWTFTDGLSVSGSGLVPGSEVDLHGDQDGMPVAPFAVGVVDANGTITWSFRPPCDLRQVYFTGTDLLGAVTSNTIPIGPYC
jgi:hypothetical protein